MAKIETMIGKGGYTLFLVDGKAVLAYQKIDNKHVLIPSEAPAGILKDAAQASRAIITILKHRDGDVVEFVNCPNNPFQLSV